MAFDYSKLRGRIIEKYGSQSAFANAIGIQKHVISSRLNNRVGISKEEIIVWSEKLGISPDDYTKYFFQKKHSAQQEERLCKGML